MGQYAHVVITMTYTNHKERAHKMMRETLINKIRSARGDMCVEIHNSFDTFHVKAVKSDLIRMFEEKFEPWEETGFEIHCNKYGVNFCVKDDDVKA